MKTKKIISAILAAALATATASALPASAEEAESLQLEGITIESALANSADGREYDINDEGVTAAEGSSTVINFNQATVSSYPSSYDMRDTPYFTSVKNQKDDGLCWAYSTLSSAESNILKSGYEVKNSWLTNGELTLSPGHLGYYPFENNSRSDAGSRGDYLHAENGGASGGNSTISAYALASGVGGQLDSNAPISYCPFGYSEYQRYASFFRLKNSEFLMSAADSTGINTVKSWIMNSGAVDTAFYSTTSCYTYKDDYTCYYQSLFGTGTTNHEVSIIGWDDNFSASNFLAGPKPAGNGAWLVKNSWGTDISPDGCMWISYYDKSLSCFTLFEMEESDTEDNIYQYDSIPCVNAYNFEATANVFTARGNETLDSVGYYVYNDLNRSTWYDIKVYLLEENNGNPTYGKLAASASGTNSFTGYKKVDIKPVTLKKGQLFSVVLTLREGSQNGKYTYSCIEEDNNSGEVGTFNFGASAGESYCLADGTWRDTTKTKGNNGIFRNVPIKAFTTNNDKTAENEIKSTLTKTVELLKKNCTEAELEALPAYQQYLEADSYKELETAAFNLLSYASYRKNLAGFPDYLPLLYDFGDPNGDGRTDSLDATLILIGYAYYLNEGEHGLTYQEAIAGDANGDKWCDSMDATAILIYYASVLNGDTTKDLASYMKLK